MKTLEQLTFDNTYARLPAIFYQRVQPTPLSNPWLVSFNPDAAQLIELDPAEAQRPEFLQYFNGERLLPGSEPIALLYAGHQFGSYVSQLGDGRAILLGEATTSQPSVWDMSSSATAQKWDLQLKGAGLTRFSRMGDGRAVLRSSIREYLCSEAMHGLGIATTRALCVIGSDEPVYRETMEPGAMITRMAPTHVRFGSFEVFAHRGQFDHLQQLADYTIDLYFPKTRDTKNPYAAFLREVVIRTARLIARWQSVGFSHGVMNTDNMSILGMTIDYGPFGFMEDYDPGFICNHSDYSGLYSFENQPRIGEFDLHCLANALAPLMSEQEAVEALAQYAPEFQQQHLALGRAKLGLQTSESEDESLLSEFFELLKGHDFTRTFRLLADFTTEGDPAPSPLRDHFIDREAFDRWAERYRTRLVREGTNDQERRTRMNRTNPKYILRNYLAQNAITAATEKRDSSEIERLLTILRDPFTERPDLEQYAAVSPEWGRKLVVNCSS